MTIKSAHSTAIDAAFQVCWLSRVHTKRIIETYLKSLAAQWKDDDMVESIAKAIAGTRWDKIERPNGTTQSREEYSYYLRDHWTDEAQTALSCHPFTQLVREVCDA